MGNRWYRYTNGVQSCLFLDVYEDFCLQVYEDGRWMFRKGERMILSGKEITEQKGKDEALARMREWVSTLSKRVDEVIATTLAEEATR